VEGLNARGLQPELFPDRDALIHRLQDESLRETCRCVVAAGGDGTVGWLINQTISLPIAIFPVGSENLLARHFGIERRGPAAARMIHAGYFRTLDLGCCNGLRFTVMASCGLDSAVVAQVHANRKGHVSRWQYAAAILRSLVRPDTHPVRFWVDDDPEPLIAYHVFVFNVATYALGLPICTEGQPDDARLDLIAFPGAGLRQLIRYFWAVMRHRGDELSDRICRRIERVRLECATPKPIQVDGDPAGALPVEIVVLPGALQLVVPRDDLEESPPER
jgi:diacylglycerol kinase family enzyme